MQTQPTTTKRERNPAETRQRLLGATVQLILKQGFAATTVDQICAESGLTKGSFFHHFPNKEAIGKAAVEWWGDFGTNLYAEAWKDEDMDPLEQFHRMLDIMSGFTERHDEVCTCVVGMLSQELAQSHPVLRDGCAHQLDVWTANVARMLTEAKIRHKPDACFEPVDIAWYLNSLWQGSMLIGKTRQAPEMIRSNLRLARIWVDGLLGKS
ncbi:TetR/AcrR family transcriptional regulator [Brevifollis gellanilyticus]|uniref:TetR family transcriptional regulator n=1 Tax=Brevifollis gellanilyticus TaxID=748831 RepID=A0A512MEY3_9BACT|nr:TetR/AcrR family transcriptional regulator [Brevifollis gellanilyticus]GEP45304.1 TetR family transcriptional regulator [Brevifollis gellanilyticus]